MKKQKWPIDLSMLTELEVQQFVDDPSTLYDGDMDVALYLRFSSRRQGEQSIEGQLRECRDFCKVKGYRIVAIYVDRAKTGSKDAEKRTYFQQMLKDSSARNWSGLIVWKLDRFARNREDSAITKVLLRKNGVRVISATENISKNPEGIILESVLEGMAEFYSVELSQKIIRGRRESAMKGQSLGGRSPLGYKTVDKKRVIDPLTAPIVKEAFTRYANGESTAEIINRFNDQGYRTSRGNPFNKNSFHAMFRNEQYLGVYKYQDIRHEGAIPAIVDQELWDRVQERLKENGLAPARGKALVDYVLVGKLFCGHCGNMMVGDSGTGKLGKKYNYYTCAARKRQRNCDKKAIKKDWLELVVAQDTLELITDDFIEDLANMAIEQRDQDLQADTIIPALEAKLSETDKGIANILAMIEKGVVSEALAHRLTELEKVKRDTERQLKKERKNHIIIEKPQIVCWLKQFLNGDIHDSDFRRKLVDLLVNSITVWDDPDGGYTITYTFNLTSTKTKTVKVKTPPNAYPAGLSQGSDTAQLCPPKEGYPNTLFLTGMVFGYTKKHHQP